MDIKYNRIINLIQLWYKSVNHSGPTLQFGEYVHILLMLSVLFHANIVSRSSYCAHGSHNLYLYSIMYSIFVFIYLLN